MITAIEILKHALIITFFVFVMMVLIDYVNVAPKGQLSVSVRGGRWCMLISSSSTAMICPLAATGLMKRQRGGLTLRSAIR